MSQPKLFQYAILWHPTEKQIKEEGSKSILLVPPSFMLAKDQTGVGMAAAMEIPGERKGELDQIEIAIRPF